MNIVLAWHFFSIHNRREVLGLYFIILCDFGMGSWIFNCLCCRICLIVAVRLDVWVYFKYCWVNSPIVGSMLWTQDGFWIFWIINFNRFLVRVLLEAYNSTLLGILLVFILSLRRQAINSHGIQYLSLCLVISVFLSFDCTGGFVF